MTIFARKVLQTANEDMNNVLIRDEKALRSLTE
jgi:hypothetical protein